VVGTKYSAAAAVLGSFMDRDLRRVRMTLRRVVDVKHVETRTRRIPGNVGLIFIKGSVSVIVGVVRNSDVGPRGSGPGNFSNHELMVDHDPFGRSFRSQTTMSPI
jgi:hypothetical protein